jgi:hypothetical protein
MNLSSTLFLIISFCCVSDNVCIVQTSDNKKVKISAIPKYKHSGELKYAIQRRGFILKNRKLEYYINEFYPEFDNGVIKIADSFYSIEAGKNSIQLYHHKIKRTPEWFVVITTNGCDCKWMAYLDEKDILLFKETIINVTFAKE